MTAGTRATSLLIATLVAFVLIITNIGRLRDWEADEARLLMTTKTELQSNTAPSSVTLDSQTKKEPIHLVYASDEQAARGTIASIRSAMEYASEPLIFHFIGNEPLESLPQVNFINLTQVTDEYNLQDFINPRRHSPGQKGLNKNLANYARFVIDSLLPNVQKAMWVDADTLFQCDVVPMMRSALTETRQVIAAVPRRGAPHGLLPTARNIKRYGKIKTSFNAGVYVVDLQRWRSANMTSEIQSIALQNQKDRLYQYGSQPPLALAIGNDFEHLNRKWNVNAGRLKKMKGREACLVHWNGDKKPWSHEKAPAKELWEPFDRPTTVNE